MSQWSIRPLVAIAILALAACGRESRECVVQSSSSAIVRGSTDIGFLGLSSEQVGAIGIFRTAATAEGPATPEAFCTAVRVSGEWLVTAAHCLSPAPSDIRLELADQLIPISFSLSDGTNQLHVNSKADVALLRVPMLPPTAVLGWATTPPVAVGDSVLIAGAGDDGDAGFGRISYAVVPVADVTNDEFTLPSGLTHAPCSGDSGGPALVRASSGAVVIAGVLSRGSPSCTGADVYERLDNLSAWLQGIVGETSSTPSACETLGSIGRCYHDVASWCDHSMERGEHCADACGWDADSKGYRCISRAEDPCDGISELGTCVANSVKRCVAGKLEVLSCDECGGACSQSSVSGFATCVVTTRPE